MDHPRFDALARRLAAGATRRAGLKAALGGLLALAALPAAEAVVAKKKHKKKRNALCPAVCPSGSACVDGACACTRELCGGACCAGNQTCQDGACVVTGLRTCDGVKIVDGADLSYCNLAGKEIKTRTLKNANFEGADLTGAKFSGQFQPWGCRFDGAILENADFYECDIKPGTTFVRANLKGAKLQAGHIDGADFSFANLNDVRFMGDFVSSTPTRITNTRFVQADMIAVDLRWVTIHGSDFTGANLPDADLAKATISSCTMANVVLNYAYLRGAVFTDTALDDAKLARAEVGDIPSGRCMTLFERCSMARVSLGWQEVRSNSSMCPTGTGLHFRDVDLSRAFFSDPYPRDVVFWLRTSVAGSTTWQQPAGGYQYMCGVTLPDGSTAPNTGWIDGAACPQA